MRWENKDKSDKLASRGTKLRASLGSTLLRELCSKRLSVLSYHTQRQAEQVVECAQSSKEIGTMSSRGARFTGLQSSKYVAQNYTTWSY